MKSSKSYFLNIAQCTDCGGSLQSEADGISCIKCKRTFRTSKGIWDMRPSENPLPTPSIYSDPDHIKMQTFIKRMAHFTYSNKTASSLHNIGHTMVEELSQDRSKITLEIGCGNAYHRKFISKDSFYIGLDYDHLSLSEGRKNLEMGPACLILGHAEKLPFCSNSISKVVTIYMLEHVYYLENVLEEVKRVLKKDGEFLVSIPAEGGLSWSLGRRFLLAWKFRDLNFDYLKAMKIEHCNSAHKIIHSINKYFQINKISYSPFRIHIIDLNLIISFRATPL